MVTRQRTKTYDQSVIRHRALVVRQWSVRMPLPGCLKLIDLKDPTLGFLGNPGWPRVTPHDFFSIIFPTASFASLFIQNWSKNGFKMVQKSTQNRSLSHHLSIYPESMILDDPTVENLHFWIHFRTYFLSKIHQRINEERDRIFGLPKIDFWSILEPFWERQGGPTNWLVFQDRPFCSRGPHQIDSWT